MKIYKGKMCKMEKKCKKLKQNVDNDKYEIG